MLASTRDVPSSLDVSDPRLPLDDGDRIVGLENRNIALSKADRQTAHDFVMWRDEMKSVVEASAFRNMTYALETGPASAEDIHVAAMTASGFRVARVGASLGRYIAGWRFSRSRHFAPSDREGGRSPAIGSLDG